MSDYERLQKLIAEAGIMIDSEATSGDPKFKAWETSVKRLLFKLFGEDSLEMKSFLSISFFSPLWSFDATSLEKHRNAVCTCRAGLEEARAILESFLDDFYDDPPALPEAQFDCSKVFIVHGHDGELKQSVARLIEKQDINAIILSEQANQGKTIIEKFENYSAVGGAICLFTADDIGRGKDESDEHCRARQNVVFETGFFMGSLGRDRVIILADDNVEIPSDLSGVVYTSTQKWDVSVLRELQELGYTIDLNKLP